MDSMTSSASGELSFVPVRGSVRSPRAGEEARFWLEEGALAALHLLALQGDRLPAGRRRAHLLPKVRRVRNFVGQLEAQARRRRHCELELCEVSEVVLELLLTDLQLQVRLLQAPVDFARCLCEVEFVARGRARRRVRRLRHEACGRD